MSSTIFANSVNILTECSITPFLLTSEGKTMEKRIRNEALFEIQKLDPKAVAIFE
jgi:hypothetical protein